jgi:hypothetical protein
LDPLEGVNVLIHVTAASLSRLDLPVKLDSKLGGPQGQSQRYGEMKNFVPVANVTGTASHGLVTIPIGLKISRRYRIETVRG